MTLYERFWDDGLWFPDNSTGPRYGWKDLENMPGSSVYYPNIYDLHMSIVLGIALIAVRYALDMFVIMPLGYRMGVPRKVPRPATENAILETAFKRYKKIDHTIVKNLAKQTDMNTKQIERWLRKQRKMDTPSSMQKFAECSWQFLFSATAFTYGTYILWDKPWLWETKYCWIGWPKLHVSRDVYWYYMFELAFYWGLIFTSFKDNKRKDRTEMLVHHVATIILIYFSWLMNLVRVGTLVLQVHDAADPLLMFGKMCNYSKHKTVKEVIFVIFVIVWFVTRLLIYPYRVLWSTTVEPYYYLIEKTFFTHIFFNFFLYLLMALHIMWSYLIANVVIKTLRKGQVEDVRSDSDSDS